MTADPWDSLSAELDRWRDAGRCATLWWRDDDAVAATPALDRLLELRAAQDVPLTLAVIPAPAEPSLADRVARETGVTVVQHGFAHRNHAPAGAPKCELGADRPPAAVADELAEGWRRLARLFDAPRPVIVPPWNRIAATTVAALPGLGYRGLSTFAARGRDEAAPGLVEANTHVDIVDWPGTRRFVGTGSAVAAAIAHLAQRREAAPGIDSEEPTGLLTHHLAHDELCWEFVKQFISRSRHHPAVRWIDADEAFGTGS